MTYSVVIRAHQANPLIVRAVENLRAQSNPPLEIIVVDSASDPQASRVLKSLADIHLPYGENDFNYSRAIQIGVAAAKASHVLIHSTHVALVHPGLIETAFRQAMIDRCAVFYCRFGDALAFDTIDATSFDGRNGLANSCAMIPRHLLLERGFREDVFSAEDQEWASWFIREKKGRVLRMTTPHCLYENPHWNIQKKVNEDLAIALFVNRRERHPVNILIRMARALLALIRKRPERVQLHWRVACGLLASHFKPLKRRSRYF
ncbi:MAG TPA: glycosyltransferase family A protein [Limnobacter sp.]|nr:glycosyltransferase family A protein [Limnobacter sp.]